MLSHDLPRKDSHLIVGTRLTLGEEQPMSRTITPTITPQPTPTLAEPMRETLMLLACLVGAFVIGMGLHFYAPAQATDWDKCGLSYEQALADPQGRTC